MKTLLLSMYELGGMGKPKLHITTPLLELKTFPIANPSNTPLSSILKNPAFNYTPRQEGYDRILIIHSENPCNARRKSLVNEKRSSLIEWSNREGQSCYLYTVVLNNICKLIPDSEIIFHLQQCFLHGRLASIKSNYHQSQSYEIKELEKILFPFDSVKWQKLLSHVIPSSMVSQNTFSQTYLSIQCINIYTLAFSLNRELLCKDLQDFSVLLGKFNFFRYFYQISPSNQFLAQKYAERLVKHLSFRTKETQRYLLMLVRSCKWERINIAVDDLILIYEKLYR